MSTTTNHPASGEQPTMFDVLRNCHVSDFGTSESVNVEAFIRAEP